MDRMELGWAPAFELALSALDDPELHAARVFSSEREHYRVLTREGRVYEAELSGKLRHDAALGGLPVVGDWVAARLLPNEQRAVVAACLPRQTALVRKRVGSGSAPQVMAANLDLVYVVSALDHDFNPRRIERALSLIWESGAKPVLLMSKLDLCGDPEPFVEAARAVALGVELHVLSAQSGEGVDPALAGLRPGVTGALIGMSGVGKSTLVNRLLGHAQQRTAAIRESDERGRHTTTRRELFVLANGALLIDTPGMRELGMFDGEDGLQAAFEDIDALASACRFADCRHGHEPGCALRAAIAGGELAEERLRSYQKLERELAHEARRHDPQAALAHRQQVRKQGRARSLDVRWHRKV
jgi:ribosome biogenesis GTPase / thiamine phosphate phosphatase